MTKKWMPTIAAQLDKHFIGIIINMMIMMRMRMIMDNGHE